MQYTSFCHFVFMEALMRVNSMLSIYIVYILNLLATGLEVSGIQSLLLFYKCVSVSNSS